MEKQVPVKIVQQKPVNLKTKKASNKITTTEIQVKQKEKRKQYKAGIKTQKREIYQRKKREKREIHQSNIERKENHPKMKQKEAIKQRKEINTKQERTGKCHINNPYLKSFYFNHFITIYKPIISYFQANVKPKVWVILKTVFNVKLTKILQNNMFFRIGYFFLGIIFLKIVLKKIF